MTASIICCRYYSETGTKLRFGIIKFYDTVSFPVCHVHHMCAASFNSRSLVYGCSTLMHASRYACNERTEGRVEADMRVRDCVRAHTGTVSRSLQHTRSWAELPVVSNNFIGEEVRRRASRIPRRCWRSHRIFMGNCQFVSLSCLDTPEKRIVCLCYLNGKVL